MWTLKIIFFYSCIVYLYLLIVPVTPFSAFLKLVDVVRFRWSFPLSLLFSSLACFFIVLVGLLMDSLIPFCNLPRNILIRTWTHNKSHHVCSAISTDLFINFIICLYFRKQKVLKMNFLRSKCTQAGLRWTFKNNTSVQNFKTSAHQKKGTQYRYRFRYT